MTLKSPSRKKSASGARLPRGRCAHAGRSERARVVEFVRPIAVVFGRLGVYSPRETSETASANHREEVRLVCIPSASVIRSGGLRVVLAVAFLFGAGQGRRKESASR